MLLFVFQLLLNSTYCMSMNNVLQYYEILKHEEAEHRIVKRSLNIPNHHRRITFNFDGKQHKLDLHQSHEILSADFKAVSIDANGVEHEISINKNTYYKGVLEGAEDSTVIAHVENNVVNAEIITRSDTIFIEPLQPHVHGDTSNDMIIYKLSDVLWNFTKSKNNMDVHPRNCGVQIKNTTQNNKSRNRRSANVALSKNICTLVLVADYEYFINVGGKDRTRTVNYMVQVISRVHNIYRNTPFGVGVNIGFNIKKVEVHEGHSNDKEHR